MIRLAGLRCKTFIPVFLTVAGSRNVRAFSRLLLRNYIGVNSAVVIIRQSKERRASTGIAKFHGADISSSPWVDRGQKRSDVLHRGFRMFSSPVCATGLESSTAGIYRKSVDSFATLPRPVDIDTRRRPLITIDKQTVRLHRQWTRCSDLHTMRGLQKLDHPREIIVAGLLKTDLRCIRYCRSTFAYNQPQKSCKEQ